MVSSTNTKYEHSTTVEALAKEHHNATTTLITHSMWSRHLPGTVKDPNGNPAQNCVLDGHVHCTFRWPLCGRRPPARNTSTQADHIVRRMHAGRWRKAIPWQEITQTHVFERSRLGNWDHHTGSYWPPSCHKAVHNDSSISESLNNSRQRVARNSKKIIGSRNGAQTIVQHIAHYEMLALLTPVGFPQRGLELMQHKR